MRAIPKTKIAGALFRLRTHVLHSRMEGWKGRACRIPLAGAQAKPPRGLTPRAGQREGGVVFRVLSSVPAGVESRFGPAHTVFQKALRRVSHSRILQSTLRSILCATQGSSCRHCANTTGDRLLPTPPVVRQYESAPDGPRGPSGGLPISTLTSPRHARRATRWRRRSFP